MKSDNHSDWVKCHYANKRDKYELIHNCTSTKYDDVYKEDSRIKKTTRRFITSKKRISLY